MDEFIYSILPSFIKRMLEEADKYDAEHYTEGGSFAGFFPAVLALFYLAFIFSAILIAIIKLFCFLNSF